MEAEALAGSRVRGLLSPTLYDSVRRLTLRPFENYVDALPKAEGSIPGVDRHLAITRANAAKHEKVALDDKTRELYQEVAYLEAARDELLEMGEVLFKKRALKHRLYVALNFTHGRKPVLFFLRQVGIVLVGNEIDIEMGSSKYEPNALRITEDDVFPIVRYANVVIYPSKAFEKALKMKKASVESTRQEG